MNDAYAVELQTPKGVRLNGLWTGPRRPTRVIVVVHGLTSSAFSRRRTDRLADKTTAVLTFNNRGFGIVNFLSWTRGTRTEYFTGGSAHEIFTDCVDDIDAAVRFAKSRGAKEIFLLGHSTGCQKSVYWASKRRGERAVKGIVLLAPISDYASQRDIDKKGMLRKGQLHARKLVQKGEDHTLMPAALGGEFPCDAQRFLSLYTPESPEEIFSYAHARVPRTLRSVRLPILVVLAEHDQHEKRSAQELAAWFMDEIFAGEAIILPADHGFTGVEKQLARSVASFMKERYN